MPDDTGQTLGAVCARGIFRLMGRYRADEMIGAHQRIPC